MTYRSSWKTVSTLVTVGLLAGCMEQSVSAPGSAPLAPTSMMMAPQGAPNLGLGSLRDRDKDNTSTDFTITPEGGYFLVGNHALSIPSRGVCDPATSSYGPGKWDEPCSPLTTSIKVHAEVRTANGRTWVDFTPAIRFVPSSDSDRWAWIWISNGSFGAKDLAKYNVLYATGIGGAMIDETAQDPTLRTYVDTKRGFSLRRIKHFSGYTSTAGFACNPYVDEDCRWVDDDDIGGGP